MPIEFQIPSLRIQVKERMSEKVSERIRLATLCELEEHWISSLLQLELELEQRQQKAFVDRHRHGNEKEFNIGKPVWFSRPEWEACRENYDFGGLAHSG